MIKILFLIHDLGRGGAEKVLVNLVNHMDRSKFDISVTALFGGGVNEQFLAPDISFRTVFPKNIPGNSKLMKLLSPEQLHKLCVKEHYDIEVSYLEGPSARVVMGCPFTDTKKICWIHVEHHTFDKVSGYFRNDKEALQCYNSFDKIICVSEYVKEDFVSLTNIKVPCEVLYNTIESDKIREQSKEPITFAFSSDTVNLIAVGTLKESKGYNRLFAIINRLKQNGFYIHLYVLGDGPQKEELTKLISDLSLNEQITLLGYDTNPYKYVAKADVFICSSFAEGFSTAATEALIVGTPVCTVDVSGMKEMLGENNEYGIVTENTEEALYEGIKSLLADPELLALYKQKAVERGKEFSTQETATKTQNMFLSLI